MQQAKRARSEKPYGRSSRQQAVPARLDVIAPGRLVDVDFGLKVSRYVLTLLAACIFSSQADYPTFII